jgi:replicative DNA helicase
MNLLQIFFEDKEKDIQRKHFSLFSKVPLSQISTPENKIIVKSKVSKFKNEIRGNELFLQKLPAEGVTVQKVKNIIKKLKSKGHNIDLLVLDYVDCLSLEKESYAVEEWSNEGKIMRALEAAIEEVDVACWTATQGNRGSTSIETVKVDNIGGSLKKAQIAHLIIGIGKTLEQKQDNVGTISILKNRLGPDGMIYKNCKFNNDSIEIDTDDVITEYGFEQERERNRLDRQRRLVEERFQQQRVREIPPPNLPLLPID